MFKKVLIAFVVSLFALSAKAQGTGEKIAEKHLDKNRFQKAYVVLKKSILKDSTNVRGTYLLARYFFMPANPDFNIDSAHAYLSKSLSLWNATSSSGKERYQRHELDSVRLQSLGAAIDSAAFHRASKSNTVDALDHYLLNYSSQIFRDSAVILRDEAAFKSAKQIGSVAAFEEYLKKYPSSKQRPEAEHLYEELLFKQETSDQQLSSYLTFLEKYPHTRFRQEIERNIFHLYTASGDEQAFERYIQKFPKTSEAHLAGEILSYLRENSIDSLPDSREYFLYPVLNKEGSFALVDPSGKEVAPSLNTKELPKNYRCGNIQDDIMSFENMLLLNNGKPIWTEEYDDYVEIGAGFVLVDTRDKIAILHKSRLSFFPDRYDDARLLNGRIFAIKSGKWGLMTLSGWKLLPFEWDEIEAIGDVLVLAKNGKVSLTTIANVTRTDGGPSQWMEGFDQVRRLPNDLVWVKSGSYEGVLNSALEILVRLEKHQVTPHPSGFILHSARGFSFINNAGVESEIVDKVEIQEPWIAMKKSGKWMITGTETLTPGINRYDSIQLLGTFAVGVRGDTMTVFSDRRNILTFTSPFTLEFLPLQGSKGFLVVHDKERKSVYTSDGTKLFTGTFDRIQAGAPGYFVIQKRDRMKKDRKGLISSNGKEILPAEYDAIGGPVDGVVSLLKDKKFGQFHLAGKSLIKAEYDKNLQPYSRNVFTALKGGKLGLIDAKNKPYTKFEFDAIHYWQDSIALVSQNKSWQLLNFHTGRPAQSAFSEIRFLRDDREEKICRVRQGNSYGVISNKRGLMIPIKFTDLVNVGSPANPVFFTEKHVEEASLFVVIYYDQSGKLIRREVYEHDEYERIYCPN